MLVTHQLRKLAICIDRNCWLVFRRRLFQRPRQCCSDFLQCVTPEVAFRGATRQVIRKPELVLARRQNANVQRNVLGGACPDVVGQAAQSFNLIVDRLFLRTPDDLLLLRPSWHRTNNSDRKNTQTDVEKSVKATAPAREPWKQVHHFAILKCNLIAMHERNTFTCSAAESTSQGQNQAGNSCVQVRSEWAQRVSAPAYR